MLTTTFWDPYSNGIGFDTGGGGLEFVQARADRLGGGAILGYLGH